MPEISEKTMWDKTPEGRYRNDANFRVLVDMMEAHMHHGDFTPSEMRMAALLGAIHFEMRKTRHIYDYTLSAQTSRECEVRLDEIYRAINTDERSIYPERFR